MPFHQPILLMITLGRSSKPKNEPNRLVLCSRLLHSTSWVLYNGFRSLRVHRKPQRVGHSEVEQPAAYAWAAPG